MNETSGNPVMDDSRCDVCGTQTTYANPYGQYCSECAPRDHEELDDALRRELAETWFVMGHGVKRVVKEVRVGMRTASEVRQAMKKAGLLHAQKHLRGRR